jgi:hypothetical protein
VCLRERERERKGKLILRRIFDHKRDELMGHGECDFANNIIVYTECPRRGKYSERSWYRSF